MAQSTHGAFLPLHPLFICIYMRLSYILSTGVWTRYFVLAFQSRPVQIKTCLRQPES